MVGRLGLKHKVMTVKMWYKINGNYIAIGLGKVTRKPSSGIGIILQ